jgi:hypothetical protein
MYNTVIDTGYISHTKLGLLLIYITKKIVLLFLLIRIDNLLGKTLTSRGSPLVYNSWVVTVFSVSLYLCI